MWRYYSEGKVINTYTQEIKERDSFRPYSEGKVWDPVTGMVYAVEGMDATEQVSAEVTAQDEPRRKGRPRKVT
jgi:hypothetical protein